MPYNPTRDVIAPIEVRGFRVTPLSNTDFLLNLTARKNGITHYLLVATPDATVIDMQLQPRLNRPSAQHMHTIRIRAGETRVEIDWGTFTPFLEAM